MLVRGERPHIVQRHPAPGRGVLQSGTHVLDAVAKAQHGIGITELARHAGLPKSTAHRLAGQLTESGLLERVDGRYFVGATVGRWGRSRRPARTLHQAANLPVKRMGQLTRALVGVVAMADGAPETVLSYSADSLPFAVDLTNDAWHRTAIGKVMCTTEDETYCPPGYSPQKWHEVRAGVLADGMIARDEQEILPGVCCIAGELRLPGLDTRAGLCALYFRNALPATATGHLVDTMRVIERNWQRALLISA